MALTDALQAWLETFPGLSGGVMHVDWLPAAARSFSVDSVPTEPILSHYMDGSTRRQLLFVVASREYYGPDVPSQEENMEWYEDLSIWVENQNIQRSFPDLGAGRQCKSIEIISTAYPVAVTDDGMARYQVQMKLTYLQEGLL